MGGGENRPCHGRAERRGSAEPSGTGQAPAETVAIVQCGRLQACRLMNCGCADYLTPLPLTVLEIHLAEMRQICRRGEDAGMAAHALQGVIRVAVIDFAHE